MAFDFKREYRSLYLPGRKPELVDVPGMNYVAVRGEGDPNEEGGAYQRAIAALYAVAYTIKMSKLGDHGIEGYFDFTVPPLEGFWQQAGGGGVDYARKADFQWIACIRLPDFVTPEVFQWAREAAARKKKLDTSMSELMSINEGLCVQCMHLGSYDDEPATVAALEAYAEASGLAIDLNDARRPHEIYLSDPRKVAVEKRKTVIRLPVRKGQ